MNIVAHRRAERLSAANEALAGSGIHIAHEIMSPRGKPSRRPYHVYQHGERVALYADLSAAIRKAEQVRGCIGADTSLK